MRPRYSTPPRKAGDLERVECRLNVFIHFCVTYKSKSSNSNHRLMDIVHVSDTMLLIHIVFLTKARLSHHFLLWFDLFCWTFNLFTLLSMFLTCQEFILGFHLESDWNHSICLSLWCTTTIKGGHHQDQSHIWPWRKHQVIGRRVASIYPFSQP